MTKLRDIWGSDKIEQLTDPATATATVTSGETDMQGYEGVFIAVSYGESADTLAADLYWSAKLQESDTSGSGFTDVAAGDVIGAATNVFGLANLPAEDDAVYSLGYRGTKRYLRAVVTAVGAVSSGMPIGVHAIKDPAKKPAGNVVTP